MRKQGQHPRYSNWQGAPKRHPDEQFELGRPEKKSEFGKYAKHRSSQEFGRPASNDKNSSYYGRRSPWQGKPDSDISLCLTDVIFYTK